MNIQKSTGSYKFIILVIIIIIILFMLIYYKVLNYNNNIDSFVDYSEYSKKYILADCVDGYGKEYKENNSNDTRSVEDICMSNAYLTDPKLLCGICGTESSPLYSMESNVINGKRYYGCKKNTDNAISLNWGDEGTQINKLLSDRLTCDTFNNGARSGMYIYIASDGMCNILVNDKVVQTHNSINLAGYYIDNLVYGDKLSIQCKQTGQSNESSSKTSNPQCGLCVSYIWNKQIYILENNGYQNCANTIYYTAEGKVKWDNIWAKKSIALLPWMKNWIRGRDGLNATLSIETFIGSTKNDGLMNNDCVIFGSLTHESDDSYISQDTAESIAMLWHNSLNKGSKMLLFDSNYKKKLVNKYYEYKVENLKEGDVFFSYGREGALKSVGKPLDLTISYIWCGKIFSTPQDDNFNKIVEPIRLQYYLTKLANDNGDFKYTLLDRHKNNNNFLYYTKMKLRPPAEHSAVSMYYFTINNINLTREEFIPHMDILGKDFANIKL